MKLVIEAKPYNAIADMITFELDSHYHSPPNEDSLCRKSSIVTQKPRHSP